MSKKIDSIPDFVFIILLLVGLSLMLYPSFSSWWNTKKQQNAVSSYDLTVGETDEMLYKQMLAAAYDYNVKLTKISSPFANYNEVAGYDSILNISDGIMGYITIPAINVELPIYHGTEAEVLAVGAGHMKGSSLPVGGKNTHAVICAHSNFASSRLFADLDQLVAGDEFTITVLDQTLTYKVEEIMVVLPSQMETLTLIPDEDYVTLMTCAPQGSDTHRLLLRSRRVETEHSSASAIHPDAIPIYPVRIIPTVVIALMLFVIIFLIVQL